MYLIKIMLITKDNNVESYRQKVLHKPKKLRHKNIRKTLKSCIKKEEIKKDNVLTSKVVQKS